MKTTVRLMYEIEMSPEEFRLVSKALRGSLKEEDREAAAKLQGRMLADRAKQVEGFHASFVGERDLGDG